jgi:hypothetical protein
MPDLTEDGRRILQAVCRGERAWRTPVAVAQELGRELGPTLDAMAELHLEGWLDVWERPEDLVVTLSARAARLLGVRLVERGRRSLPRWAGRRDPEPRRRAGPGRAGDEPAGDVTWAGDPSPTAEEAVIARESATDRGTRGRSRPSLLIGLNLCPWPGPGQRAPGAPCPGCRGARLPADRYCLCCDRCGADAEDVASRRQRRTPPRQDRAATEARRNAERSRRRSRRRERLRALSGK